MAHCPECDRRAFMMRVMADALVGAGTALTTRNPLIGDVAGAAMGPLVEQAVLETLNIERHPSGLAERMLRPSPAARGGTIKKKVSKYQKQLGKELKKLKKKHPRTKMASLMKRAHRAARKKVKRK
jgi:hypothetical protein